MAAETSDAALGLGWPSALNIVRSRCVLQLRMPWRFDGHIVPKQSPWILHGVCPGSGSR